MAHTRIPSYTSKYIRDLADKHWHGCFDKVPTTPIQSLRIRDIEIRSRYCKADVDITPWDTHTAQVIAEHVEQIAIKCNEGHNGIWVVPEGGSVSDEPHIEREACWPDIKFLTA